MSERIVDRRWVWNSNYLTMSCNFLVNASFTYRILQIVQSGFTYKYYMYKFIRDIREHLTYKQIAMSWSAVTGNEESPKGCIVSSHNSYNWLNSEWLFLLTIISRRKLRKPPIFSFFILFRPIIFHAISIQSPTAAGSPGPVQLRWWRSVGIRGFCQIYDNQKLYHHP